MTVENKETEINQPRKAYSFFTETLVVFAQAFILAMIVRTFLFQPFSIPSGSMMPTLLIGDYLFVSKFSYGYSRYSLPYGPDLFSGRVWDKKPDRGDVVVFKYPPDPSQDYIKRVVGLPGDRIQMINGILHINGTAVKRRYTGDFYDEKNGFKIKVPIYTETLPNGVSYKTLDSISNGFGDHTKVFQVPENHYFMMGDNRDNSTDSRYAVGYVPYENLVGPAEIVFFSVSKKAHPLAFWRWPWVMRVERFFSWI